MSSKKVLSIVATLIAVVLVVYFPKLSGTSTDSTPSTNTRTETPPSQQPPIASAPQTAPAKSNGTVYTSSVKKSAGFASAQALNNHFGKHGQDFGDVTVEQYLALARELRDAPEGDSILEAVRDDSVITRFDKKTGSFIAFDVNGTIKTFFKPNDGVAYFERQIDKAH